MLQVFFRNYVDNLTTDVFDVDNWQKSYEEDILESRNDIVGHYRWLPEEDSR